MKLKIKEIIEILDSIELLSKEKIPIKFAWKIEKLRKSILPFFENYAYSIEQIKSEKALKNADGTFVLAKTEFGQNVPEQMVFDPRDIDLLDSRINDLLEEEVELENSCLIKIYDISCVEIPLKLIRGIDKVIVE